ncbi:MAG TPA: DUF58 domain-containing protein [Polyangiaceae bacterium LLY-WYZ-15_(1-7)]|nr:DUF58 domain-containing protein [Myxococcales bacterium]MAT25763.1 DUF58 domain-containing protein [Sandaracinus sp.]HJL04346.1 DUF58 domain-containing protein [Polyangiaceae bacterium LLY-WYZ-15_(1-7)]MBJ70755.1 DUF58 domain-containing protein [Sandaracinus sp.]HJL11877.1 DUF58 domain-containing protein [Polyangiaceae bacterium LLY-WYZ-15_(1-7)]
MSSSLLDPDFIRRLARLRLLARRRFAGAAGGARRSTRRGQSVEFADHRPYAPGDDVRRIDWNAYARLEELVLRLYIAEEDLSVYLLMDTSASLAFGDPPKLEVAKRIAAALAYVGLTGSERVGVVPFAEGMRAPLAPTRGKGRVGTVLRFLDALEPAGETNLARSVESFLARRPRPGLVVLLSDLLDPGGWQRPLERLLGEKHEPVVFQVLDAEELDPTPGGDFTLVDAERGTRVDVSLDARAVAAYRARVVAFLESIAAWCKRRGVTYVRAGGEVPFEEALLSYLRAA